MEKIKIIDLAEKIGITHSAISQWKSKKKIPSSKIFIIAEVINVNPAELNKNPNLLFNLFRWYKKVALSSSAKVWIIVPRKEK